MDEKEFDILLDRRNARTKAILASKNKEYASAKDKLHNFKRAGKMKQETPEKALIGMWTKHVISILDIVDDLDNGKHPSKKLIDEKIGDTINYMILLEALFNERLEDGKEKENT